MAGPGDGGLDRTATDAASGREDTARSDEPALANTAASDESALASAGAAEITLPELQLASREAYAITTEIGRGGLGRVLRARDPMFGRTIAVKELLSDHPDARARFLREAMITARLQHPAIVPVYVVGRWPSGAP